MFERIPRPDNATLAKQWLHDAEASIGRHEDTGQTGEVLRYLGELANTDEAKLATIAEMQEVRLRHNTLLREGSGAMIDLLPLQVDTVVRTTDLLKR